MTHWAVDIRGLCRGFDQADGRRLAVLRGLNLEMPVGELLTITGASGCGKSTLLHIIACLDVPEGGVIRVMGQDLGSLGRRDKRVYRNRTVGMVYQFHHLLPELTVLENVLFPALIHRFDVASILPRARRLLDRVGLGDREGSLPAHLSGGERQRAAIARGLINSPRLLLADEPTGSLDEDTGQVVFELFRELVAEEGISAMVVSHNQGIAGRSDRVLRLEHGALCVC